MTLTNALAPYLTIRDAIITLLKANLTVVNTDLTYSVVVTNIDKGDPTVEPVPLTRVPCIFVRFDGKPEEQFLASQRKGAKIIYRIFGITRRVGKVGPADDEMTNLARNIESIFRNNINISNNVLLCNPSSLELGIGIGDNKSFISVSTLTLEAEINIS